MQFSLKKTTVMLLALALVLVLIYGIVTKLVQTKTASLQAELSNRIAAQSTKLVTIADATKQNNGNESVAQVVKDCDPVKRKDFDMLLDKLSTSISAPELTKLSGLFYQCGNFYAQQRSMMALILNREVIALQDMVSESLLLSSDNSKNQADVKQWQNIATAETKISTYFTELVDLQGTIITELQAGKTATSPELITVLTEVSKVRGQMVVLSKQVEDYRAALTSI